MIVVVAGVAGSGKSTVGQMLARRLGWLFADGDSFHPAANIAKMEAGLPLTDADRRPWLAAIESWMEDVIASGQSAVLAASALKRRYRETMMGGRTQVEMVFLVITKAQCELRLVARKGHFFHGPLMASQFDELEMPDSEERVFSVPVGQEEPGQIVAEIIKLLGLRV